MNMISISCFRIAQLLLCLFVFGLLSCSSLINVDDKRLRNTQSTLQFAVNENDFLGFKRHVQELGLVAVDFRPAFSNVSGRENNEFWVTFRFVSEDALIRSYVSLMSNGSVRRISYPTQ